MGLIPDYNRLLPGRFIQVDDNTHVKQQKQKKNIQILNIQIFSPYKFLMERAHNGHPEVRTQSTAFINFQNNANILNNKFLPTINKLWLPYECSMERAHHWHRVERTQSTVSINFKNNANILTITFLPTTNKLWLPYKCSMDRSHHWHLIKRTQSTALISNRLYTR